MNDRLYQGIAALVIAIIATIIIAVVVSTRSQDVFNNACRERGGEPIGFYGGPGRLCFNKDAIINIEEQQ